MCECVCERERERGRERERERGTEGKDSQQLINDLVDRYQFPPCIENQCITSRSEVSTHTHTHTHTNTITYLIFKAEVVLYYVSHGLDILGCVIKVENYPN